MDRIFLLLAAGALLAHRAHADPPEPAAWSAERPSVSIVDAATPPAAPLAAPLDTSTPAIATPLFPAPQGPPAITLLPPCGVDPESWRVRLARRRPVLAALLDDYGNFYDAETLGHATLLFGGHAALANTNADEWLQDRFHDVVSGEASDFAKAAKLFGEGDLVIPLVAGVSIACQCRGGEPECLSEWAGRSLRAYAVGVPVLSTTQWAVGASRPGERDNASRWRPFADDNGVSGHAFVGAVPFLSAAKMTQSRPLKTVLYAGSMLTALSRIDDDSHFTSQAVAGWGLALLATDAVDNTLRASGRVRVSAGMVGSLPGVWCRGSW